MPSCISKPSAVRDSGGIMIPALLTRMSMGPSQPSANSRTEARLARSRRRTSVVPDISDAAASPLSVLRTARTTRAPWPASAPAAARPMPLLAPVTMTVLPVMSGMEEVEKVGMGNNVGAVHNVVKSNFVR